MSDSNFPPPADSLMTKFKNQKEGKCAEYKKRIEEKVNESVRLQIHPMPLGNVEYKWQEMSLKELFAGDPKYKITIERYEDGHCGQTQYFWAATLSIQGVPTIDDRAMF